MPSMTRLSPSSLHLLSHAGDGCFLGLPLPACQEGSFLSCTVSYREAMPPFTPLLLMGNT